MHCLSARGRPWMRVTLSREYFQNNALLLEMSIRKNDAVHSNECDDVHRIVMRCPVENAVDKTQRWARTFFNNVEVDALLPR